MLIAGFHARTERWGIRSREPEELGPQLRAGRRRAEHRKAGQEIIAAPVKYFPFFY